MPLSTSKGPNPNITDRNDPQYTPLNDFNNNFVLRGLIGDADAYISNGFKAHSTVKPLAKGTISAGDHAVIGNRKGMVTSVLDYDIKLSIETLSGDLTLGETVTGGTSGATGVVVAFGSGFVLLETITDEFEVAETITGGTSTETADITAIDTAPGILAVTVNEDMRYLSPDYALTPEDQGYDADGLNRTVTYCLVPADGLLGSLINMPGQASLYTGPILIMNKNTADPNTWPKSAQDQAQYHS